MSFPIYRLRVRARMINYTPFYVDVITYLYPNPDFGLVNPCYLIKLAQENDTGDTAYASQRGEWVQGTPRYFVVCYFVIFHAISFLQLQIWSLTIWITKILAIISCLCKKGCMCRRKTPRCRSLSRKAIIMATLLLGLHPTGRIIPPCSVWTICLSSSLRSTSVVSTPITFSENERTSDVKDYSTFCKNVTFYEKKQTADLSNNSFCFAKYFHW